PESVLGNYSITYGTGTFTITARPLEITAGSASKTYNGEPLTANTYKITGGGLAEGDKLVSVQITGSQTSVGSSPNKASNAVIKRGEEDVTANYAITYVDGLLTVTSTSTPPPPPPPPEEEIPDDFPPLLNLEDHFAYIDGYPDNTVRPEGLITREEVAAVFFRLLDPDYREVIRAYVSNFSDVSPDRWSSKHIATLARGRILEGYPDGTFRPGNFITRAELATIAARFDELSFLEENVFPDVEGHWAEKYINSAAAKGWVEGYPDGTFRPDDYITRAEFVTLVNRVLQRRVRLEDILSEARQFPDLLPGKWYYEAMQEAINSHLYERKDDGFETWLEITYPEIEM
ncbi:MAG TPA: S-layer homology domain-containing protein, partial [Firmicutes bacterium]|nr:S-layer homology domain-containing protein [Candidatus Fermentithermobacillaceae bacterium]